MARKIKDSPQGKDTKPKAPDNWWVRGTSETCAFFGVSAQTLSDWEKRGAPKEGYGKWDIKKMVEWKHGAKAGDMSPEARKLMAEADYREAKAAQEGIKLAVQRGEYIATAEVTQDLKRLFTVLKRSLIAIGHDVATEINTMDPDAALAAKKVVDNEIYEALKQIAEKGEYVCRK
ncbi:hypothetical protein SDC9_04150 [bioreactor metagenome]|uniref:Uncharacterized protein n=1 Tax=bioreactor metagenome TaxID=1076179 RepID=A0A644SVD6_9ZZZZ|nr:hypothetical protein [Negativicutes bacterium]